MSYREDFEISKINFNAIELEAIQSEYFVSDNWPIVYILNDNGVKKAYVGETLDVNQRMSTHLLTDGKSNLKEAHFITSRKFNKSVTLDIESNLIKYLHADGVYKLLNGNLGLGNHSYYQKEDYYTKLFKEIWNSLISKGIAKHSLEHITNSDLYKYSPYKTLSIDQRENLMTIIDSLLSEDRKTIVAEGGSGTGKTVLAVFLFKLILSSEEDFNYKEFGDDELEFVSKIRELKLRYPSPKMGLVIAMSSFRQTIQNVFKNVDGLSDKMVIGPSDVAKNKYDILLVDEAHRLRQRVNLTNYKSFDDAAKMLGFDPKMTNEVEWVEKQSQRSIYFYDPLQSIKPSDVNEIFFDNLKNLESTVTLKLISQFRSKGGNGYVRFVKNLLNQRLDEDYKYFDKNYDVLLFDNFKEFVDQLRNRNKEHKLSRFVAGYGWEWKSKNDKSLFDIKIDDIEFQWNRDNIDYISKDVNAEQIGCIHTSQGYDLNYTGIIFGPEIILNPYTQEIEVVKDNYFDTNGKNTIRDPKILKEYIINIYTTIMLRGIMGCYVYVVDKNLREYFKNHMNIYVGEQQEKIEELEIDPSELVLFENAVPLYSIKAAAGDFFANENSQDFELYPVPEGLTISEDHFACKIIGNSMNKIVEDGQIALFRKYTGGSRNGLMVLVKYRDKQDDYISEYTFKEYYSDKIINEGEWEHKRIILKPKSYDSSYKEIELKPEDVEGRDLEVIGVFERVL